MSDGVDNYPPPQGSQDSHGGRASDRVSVEDASAQPQLRAILSASVVATIGVLPVFLLSSTGVLVRQELGFTEAQLGISVSIYFGSAAVGSLPGGRIAERVGPRPSLALGAAISGVALLGMSVARSWLMLLVFLVLGGFANALCQLGANLRLADAVKPSRQGIAFGIKQSATPAATLLGGLAVPIVAITLGWRWGFGLAAVVALVLVLVLVAGQSSRQPSRKLIVPTRNPRSPLARRPLAILAVGVAFGAAAAVALAAFVVEYAVAVGIDPGPAGVLLAVSSVAAIAMRLGIGWFADARASGGTLLVVAGLLAAGAIAVMTFPFVSTWLPLTVVTIVAYAAGWGWPGLFNLSIVRGNPQAPAAATGVTQTGIYVGGMAGPLIFGLLVTNAGYLAAWGTVAAWLFTGAALVLVGRLSARKAWLTGATLGCQHRSSAEGGREAARIPAKSVERSRIEQVDADGTSTRLRYF